MVFMHDHLHSKSTLMLDDDDSTKGCLMPIPEIITSPDQIDQPAADAKNGSMQAHLAA